MLISCDDLRKLCVIPADFPNAVLSVRPANNLSHLKAKLLRQFDTTLSDDLNPEPHASLRLDECPNTMNRNPKEQ